MVAACSLVPLVAFAKVTINEVAWMGTPQSSLGEWIELFNDGSVEVDLSGAGLYVDGGGTLLVSLTKKIAAGGYYLVERSTPSVPDPVPGVGDDTASFGGGGLSNAGENLVLKAKDGTVLDSVNALLGWPAGDNETKETMQKNGSGWMTATSTPRAKNTIFESVVSLTATSSVSSPDVATSNLSSHSGSASLSDEKIPDAFSISIGRDRLVNVGTPILFEAKTKGQVPSSVDFRWSFGDGGSSSGRTASKTYAYPGEYVVIVNAQGEGVSAVARAVVKVTPIELSLTGHAKDSALELTNRSAYEANIGLWSISAGPQSFVLPTDTIILPKHTVFLGKNITRMSLYSSSTPVLVSPDFGIVVTGTPISLGEAGTVAVAKDEKSTELATSVLSQLTAIADMLGDLRKTLVRLTQN